MDKIKLGKIEVLLSISIILIFASGCGYTRHVVPRDLQHKTRVIGLSDIRAFGDEPDEAFINDMIQSIKDEPRDLFPKSYDGSTTYPALLLSGGGGNGAYGAGILNGWTAEGSRPDFKIVTGISTGALIASYAFLGSDYDHTLKEFYTKTTSKDIMKKKGPIGVLTGNSFADNKPLEKIIREMIDEELLQEIAEEHIKGRRFYIGTTNLDAQRLVLWNMGKIALMANDLSLGERAENLFENILLASSAIPAVFPPVFIDVEVDGEMYDEMHVDGGTATQVFFMYGVLKGLRGSAREQGINADKIKINLYIIRNGYISPRWKEVKNSLMPITERALDTLILYQGIGDIFRLHTMTEKTGNDYNLAFIPEDFEFQSKEMFDPEVMGKLYDRGYEQAIHGYPWAKEPPMLEGAGQ